jgi:Fe/S biogenesis protein NfuA
VAQAVQDVLDREVNPAVAGHGGQVELVAVEAGAAILSFGGGCQGCGMVDVTLKQGVEVAIVNAVPEITEVRDVTDHAAGTNPYFESAGESPF